MSALNSKTPVCRMSVRLALVMAFAGMLAACTAMPDNERPPLGAVVDAQAVLAHPGRPLADRERDAARQASRTLDFMQIRPGMSVFELLAGGGYWTEILSHATGTSGQVVMQNPPGFAALLASDISARLAGGRLGNVIPSVSRFDALAVADGSMDRVVWVLGPHDLHYTPPDGVSLGDPAASWREIARILAPDGRLIVVDHSAVAVAPASTGQTLHRIDPALTIADARAVGLELEASADFLANPDDPRTQSAFDPAIRGRTDQHVLRFRRAG